MGKRRRGRRNPGPGLPVIVGAVLLTGAFAALLFLPAWEPGEGVEEDPGGGVQDDVPVRTLERGDLPAFPGPEERIRVEVLNAGGVPGMAARATDHLRSLGFDVVYFGNARTFDREETAVLDRSGSPEAARAVARALGVAEADQALDPGLLLDVTVLLGRGWTPPDPDDLEAAGDEWWSPRRLMERMRSLDQGR
jgi:hypothetical protein